MGADHGSVLSRWWWRGVLGQSHQIRLLGWPPLLQHLYLAWSNTTAQLHLKQLVLHVHHLLVNELVLLLKNCDVFLHLVESFVLVRDCRY